MEDYVRKRVRYPFEPPFLFDCRFHGAGELIVQHRYQDFLNRFHAVSQSVDFRNDRIACAFSDIDVDILAILKDVQEKGLSPTQMFCRTKLHRMKIAEQVSKEIGRDVSGDDVRRMGIGDQIVLFATLQAIARKFGPDSVRIVFDPLYGGTRDILDMMMVLNPMPTNLATALPEDDINDVAQIYGPVKTMIDLRRHFLEHPLQDGIPCFYGTKMQSPMAQFLWNMGWEDALPEHKTADIHMEPPAGGVNRANEIIHSRPYIVCQPLELTRRNDDHTPRVWSTLLQAQPIGDIIVGGAKNEERKIHSFVKAMDMPQRYKVRVVCEHMGTWLALIKGASAMYTGNSSGMWFGFAMRVPMTILSKTGGIHGTMWEPHQSWFSEEQWKRIRVIA